MIRIEEIHGEKALKKFVQFAIELYKDNEYYVPPIISDEVANISPKNPSLDFCDAVFYMAYDEKGKAVGRIAGFINPRYNEKSGEKLCRFGYVDFIDDKEVSKVLFETLAKWGRNKGMSILAGPLGMTDLDYEGALIEGFDQLGTISTIYNYPYYIEHYMALGMMQDAKWDEYLLPMPDEMTDRHKKMSEFIINHYGLKVFSPTNAKKLVSQYGKRIFQLLNETYSQLYCVSELDEKQMQYYIDKYLPLLPLDCICLVTDKDDNLISFGITCPSLARAQQKAKGHMFPFGWYYMAKAMYLKGGTDLWDLMLIGVRPDYQSKGVTALLFAYMFEFGKKRGFKCVSAYPQLSDNHKVQYLWKNFEHKINRRRATFKKEI